MPTKITFGYNALGQKVRKMVLDPNAPSGVTTDYLSGFQYKNGILQFFPHAEGYVNATATIPPFGGEATYDFNYVYNYTDHLGNIRLSYSVDPASQEVKIMEENHYYPFGLKHTNYNSDWLIYGRQNESTVLKKPGPIVKYEPVYKYKYNDKEYQDELGLNTYDYGARNYDPALGRWMNIDPLAEKGRRWSPYCYTMNNPINLTDPDGRWPIWPIVKALATAVGNYLKGHNSGTQQRYQTEPARGDTKTGLRDTKAGRISNTTGKPVGDWVVRADQAHKNAPEPHFNVNPKATGLPDPHTKIPGGVKTLKALENTGKTIDAISKVAKPVAIVTDVVKIGDAINQDGGTVGKNTVVTGASVAGGWVGASVGASVGATIGAEGGAVTGAAIGVWFGGVGAVPGAAIGGFIGGLGGGIAGAFGGSWLAEEGAKKAIETVE